METRNDQVHAAARAELARDQRLPYADAIAVDVKDSVVTLRGTVGSLGQRRAAVADARRPPGVSHVDDQLKLELLHGDGVRDARLAGQALQRLIDDPDVPAGALDVEVREGWLTLRGLADSQRQSDSAFDAVAGAPGVVGVTNEITVVQPGAARAVGVMPDRQVRENVISELIMSVRFDDQAIDVSVADGVVRLRGTLGSAREKLAALDTARRVEGVRDINDQLDVELLDSSGRDDAHVRASVLRALSVADGVPASVGAHAAAGVVTLTGTAEHESQRAAAESVAAAAAGDWEVTDEIVLRLVGERAIIT